MTGKKLRAKVVKREPPADPALRLDVEVLQYGAMQINGSWSPKRLFSKSVTFGVGIYADLQLPYSKLPPKIEIFQISKGKVYAVLDPRVEGFVNRGHEFGDVSEFLRPRGALAEVATVDDPLRVELQPGSRGALRVYGYEVIFKYEKPAPPKRVAQIEGAGRGVFERPETDSPMESRALWIGLAAVALTALPFSAWLAKGKVEQLNGITDLPQEFLARIVDPGHMRMLPRVLEGFKRATEYREEDLVIQQPERDEERDPRTEFRKDILVSQSAYMVKELQKRWRYSEDGISTSSDIDLFRFVSPVRTYSGVAENWRVVADGRYEAIEKKRKSSGSDRYWSSQVETPRLAVVTTNERRGSIRTRVARRLNDVRKMRAALYSLIETEQRFVHDYYKSNVRFMARKDVDLGPLFEQPAPAIFNAKPEPLFHWEIERYQAAEALARCAERLPGRLRFSDETGAVVSDNIWLARDGLVVPAFSGASVDEDTGAEVAMLKNARYSLSQEELPPPPPVPPRVDSQGVKFAIVNHKEEIKSCYEAVLRRNPSASGLLTMRWDIEPSGRARKPTVISGTLRDKELETCLAARLEQWRFPKPVGGTVSFEYPFRFLSQQR